MWSATNPIMHCPKLNKCRLIFLIVLLNLSVKPDITLIRFLTLTLRGPNNSETQTSHVSLATLSGHSHIGFKRLQLPSSQLELKEPLG